MNAPVSSPPAPPGALSLGGLWRWAPVLLVAAAWLAHAPARGHGWVLDDVHLVRDNPVLERGFGGIAEILRGGANDMAQRVEHGSHGPVALASFAVEASLWRRADGTLDPGGFHLTNLLLHGLCVLLLFRVFLVLARGRPVLALGAALVFAVHPMFVGTVSALMGRAAILAALFSLATALAWRRFTLGQLAWLPAAAVLWLLALLSHPAALGVPLVLAGFTRGRARLGLATLLLPLGVFLATGGGTPATPGWLAAQGVGARLLVGCEGLLRAMIGLFVPVGLRGDHTDEAVAGQGYPADSGTYIALAALVVITIAVLLWRRRRGPGAASTLWLGTLALALPAMAVLPAGAPLEARWAYVVLLPFLGLPGVLAEGLLAVGGLSDSFVRLRAAMVTGLVVVCLMGLAHREADAWVDDDAFHEHLLERNPRHVRAMVRHAESQRLAAVRYRDQSTVLRSDDPERGVLLAWSRGALDAADRWSQRAVRHELSRRDPDAWRTRGFVLLAVGRSAQALSALERARDLDPLLKQPPKTMLATFGAARLALAADMYFSIGRAREALGDGEAAADALLTAARLQPERVDLLYRAGMALCRVNRYAEGLDLLVDARRRAQATSQRDEIDEALRASRDAARDVASRILAKGHAAKAEGDMRAAATLYEQALEVNPASVEAWSFAGWLRGHWFGNYEQADAYLSKAEGLLTKGEIPADDPRWERVRGFRRMLAEQRAAEDAEAEGR
ncbi:MAG: tetratricopeptide repeat protein [Planctomycetota bacterium]|nr:tetratricopeptide repeat protein [Planctomycetota bacterium]